MPKVLIIEKKQQIIARAIISGSGKLSLENIDPRYSEVIELLVQKINTDGPELRQPISAPNGMIGDALVFVKPADKNYDYALEDEFVRVGFVAKVLDEARAHLWETVRASYTDLDFQETVLRNITLFSDTLIYDITKEFETYEKIENSK